MSLVKMMSSRILATAVFEPSVNKVRLEYLKANKQRLFTIILLDHSFPHLETSPAKAGVF